MVESEIRELVSRFNEIERNTRNTCMWTSEAKSLLYQIGEALVDVGYCYKEQWFDTMYTLTEVDVTKKYSNYEYPGDVMNLINEVWQKIPLKKKIQKYSFLEKVCYQIRYFPFFCILILILMLLFFPASHYTLCAIGGTMLSVVLSIRWKLENIERNALILTMLLDIIILVDYVYFNEEWEYSSTSSMKGVAEKTNVLGCLLYNCLVFISFVVEKYSSAVYLETRRCRSNLFMIEKCYSNEY